MTKYFGLDIDEIIKRLIDSSGDTVCYLNLLNVIQQGDKPKMELKKYNQLKKEDKIKALKNVCKRCSYQDKFRGWAPYAILIQSIWKDAGLPDSKVEKIFGHVDDEKDIYNDIIKFLRKQNSFKNLTVIDTHKKRGKQGIRFADITLFKKKSLLGKLNRYVLSVEVKAKNGAFDHLLSQLADASLFSRDVYAVVTPGLLVEESVRRESMNKAGKSVLNKLKMHGSGIIIYDPVKRACSIISYPSGNILLRGQEEKKALENLDLLEAKIK